MAPKKVKKPKPAVCVESLFEKDIPAGAQVMLFGKARTLLFVDFIELNKYTVTIHDGSDGKEEVVVSGEHEVLTGSKIKSDEEIAAERKEEEKRKQVIVVQQEKAKAEKLKAEEDAARKQSADDAMKRAKATAADAIQGSGD